MDVYLENEFIPSMYIKINVSHNKFFGGEDFHKFRLGLPNVHGWKSGLPEKKNLNAGPV